METDSIARLKITLNHVVPAVMRRIEVPLEIPLDQLHLVLQAAMGWSNDHLYEIRAAGVGWGIPDPDWPGDGPRDAAKVRLVDVIEGIKTLKYLYDFGDGWEHKIKIERLVDPVPGILYPRLIAATGRCPPEDVGGPWGYADFLDVIGDPEHPRHAELSEWVDDDFDPAVADTDARAEEVALLTSYWSRKPAAKRARAR